MKTEYAHSMAKDFNLKALAEIRTGAANRAQWCREEAKRRHASDLWSLQDAKDLMNDATEFEQLARALDTILNS